MRLWPAALLILIACGGKIATEFDDVPGGPTPGPYHGGDDDDDDDDDDVTYPGKKPSSSGTSGYSSSGYPYPSSSSSSGVSSSSSGGTLPGCNSVTYGCGGDEDNWKCFLQGSPYLSCYGDNRDSYAYCSCIGYGGTYDAGYEGGSGEFTVPTGQGGAPDGKMLYSIWNTYCGGYCK